MKRLVVFSVALALTLVMAAPAAANQKVEIGPFSFQWQEEIDLDNCDYDSDLEEWVGWGCYEGWECVGPDDERLWYNGDFSGSSWFWYKKGVDTSDPEVITPEDRPWPWVKGKAKSRGVDTYSTLPGPSGKVISGRSISNELYNKHKWTDTWETFRVQVTGKDFGVRAPGCGKLLHASGNYRVTIEQDFGEPFMYNETDERFVGNAFYEDEDSYRAAIGKLCDCFGYDANILPWD